MSYQAGKAKNVISEKLHEAKDAVGLGHGGAYSNVDSSHKVHESSKGHAGGILSTGGAKETTKVEDKKRVSTHQDRIL